MCRVEYRASNIGSRAVGFIGCKTRVGLPNTEVNDEMRIEIHDDLGDIGGLVQGDAFEGRAIEATPGWIGIDAKDWSDPTLFFEHRCGKRSKFTAASGDENSLRGHDVSAIRGREESVRERTDRAGDPQCAP